LLQLVVEQRQLEKTLATGFREAAAGCCGINLALVLVVNDEIIRIAAIASSR